jgi:hypothetical protein
MAALMACASACDAKDAEVEDNRRHVTPASSADATATVVDDAQGFTLKQPGPGWKLLSGADATGLCPGAAAAGLGPDSIVGTVHVRQLEGELKAHVEGIAGSLGLDGRKVQMGSQRTEGDRTTQYFDVAGAVAGIDLSYSGIAIARGKTVYEVLVWAPKGDHAAGIKSFFDAFSLADAAGKATSVPDVVSEPIRVGSDWALRDGRYRDFRLALTWTAPAGWTLQAGEAARAVNPDARLYLHNAKLGLHALLVGQTSPNVDAAAYHQALVSHAQKTVALVPGKAATSRLGDKPGLVTAGAGTVGGAPVQYRLYSAIHSDHALQVVGWGADGNAAALDALAKSVTLEVALPAVETTTSVHRDHRLGYTLTTPAGWIRKTQPHPALDASGTLVRWDRAGRWIAVLAVAVPGGATRQAWMAGFLEQFLRDELGTLTRAPITTKPATLGGQPATRLSWHAAMHHVDTFVMQHGGVAYAAITVDNSEEASALVERSFALLP